MFAKWFGKSVPQVDRFSTAQLENLHLILQRERNRGAQGDVAVIIETLKQISELMIYGDRQSETSGLSDRFFEIFCEHSMMRTFVQLFRSASELGLHWMDVQVQVLQTISILLMNINNQRSLFYLLSNNHINDLIISPFNEGHEEIVGYYISLLKTLSLSLNSATVQFYFKHFDEKQRQKHRENNPHSDPLLDSFPLYTQCVKFHSSEEQMVRTAVRTVTLNVYNTVDPDIRSFLCRGVHSLYPYQVSINMKRLVTKLNNILFFWQQDTEGAELVDRVRSEISGKFGLSSLEEVASVSKAESVEEGTSSATNESHRKISSCRSVTSLELSILGTVRGEIQSPSVRTKGLSSQGFHNSPPSNTQFSFNSVDSSTAPTSPKDRAYGVNLLYTDLLDELYYINDIFSPAEREISLFLQSNPDALRSSIDAQVGYRLRSPTAQSEGRMSLKERESLFPTQCYCGQVSQDTLHYCTPVPLSPGSIRPFVDTLAYSFVSYVISPFILHTIRVAGLMCRNLPFHSSECMVIDSSMLRGSPKPRHASAINEALNNPGNGQSMFNFSDKYLPFLSTHNLTAPSVDKLLLNAAKTIETTGTMMRTIDLGLALLLLANILNSVRYRPIRLFLLDALRCDASILPNIVDYLVPCEQVDQNLMEEIHSGRDELSEKGNDSIPHFGNDLQDPSSSSSSSSSVPISVDNKSTLDPPALLHFSLYDVLLDLSLSPDERVSSNAALVILKLNFVQSCLFNSVRSALSSRGRVSTAETSTSVEACAVPPSGLIDANRTSPSPQQIVIPAIVGESTRSIITNESPLEGGVRGVRAQTQPAASLDLSELHDHNFFSPSVSRTRFESLGMLDKESFEFPDVSESPQFRLTPFSHSRNAETALKVLCKDPPPRTANLVLFLTMFIEATLVFGSIKKSDSLKGRIVPAIGLEGTALPSYTPSYILVEEAWKRELGVAINKHSSYCGDLLQAYSDLAKDSERESALDDTPRASPTSFSTFQTISSPKRKEFSQEKLPINTLSGSADAIFDGDDDDDDDIAGHAFPKVVLKSRGSLISNNPSLSNSTYTKNNHLSSIDHEVEYSNSSLELVWLMYMLESQAGMAAANTLIPSALAALVAAVVRSYSQRSVPPLMANSGVSQSSKVGDGNIQRSENDTAYRSDASQPASSFLGMSTPPLTHSSLSRRARRVVVSLTQRWDELETVLSLECPHYLTPMSTTNVQFNNKVLPEEFRPNIVVSVPDVRAFVRSGSHSAPALLYKAELATRMLFFLRSLYFLSQTAHAPNAASANVAKQYNGLLRLALAPGAPPTELAPQLGTQETDDLSMGHFVVDTVARTCAEPLDAVALGNEVSVVNRYWISVGLIPGSRLVRSSYQTSRENSSVGSIRTGDIVDVIDASGRIVGPNDALDPARRHALLIGSNYLVLAAFQSPEKTRAVARLIMPLLFSSASIVESSGPRQAVELRVLGQAGAVRCDRQRGHDALLFQNDLPELLSFSALLDDFPISKRTLVSASTVVFFDTPELAALVVARIRESTNRIRSLKHRLFSNLSPNDLFTTIEKENASSAVNDDANVPLTEGTENTDTDVNKSSNNVKNISALSNYEDLCDYDAKVTAKNSILSPASVNTNDSLSMSSEVDVSDIIVDVNSGSNILSPTFSPSKIGKESNPDLTIG